MIFQRWVHDIFVLTVSYLTYKRSVIYWLLSGDYWGDHDWRRGDADDPLAMDAYNALLRVALYEPNGTNFIQFSADVKNRSKSMYNFTYGSEKVKSSVMASE